MFALQAVKSLAGGRPLERDLELLIVSHLERLVTRVTLTSKLHPLEDGEWREW